MTPARNHFPIARRITPSRTRWSSTRPSWARSTLSKKCWMSRSTTQPPPMSISPRHTRSSAWCAPRPGRNPYEQSRQSCSYIGSSAMTTARCRTLSSSVGMPMGRVCLPTPALGMCTRRTAGARYRPDWNRSSTLVRFASNAVSYCAAVRPRPPPPRCASACGERPPGANPHRCGEPAS